MAAKHPKVTCPDASELPTCLVSEHQGNSRRGTFCHPALEAWSEEASVQLLYPMSAFGLTLLGLTASCLWAEDHGKTMHGIVGEQIGESLLTALDHRRKLSN